MEVVSIRGPRALLFNSIHFLVFFPVVAATYFALPHRFRWVLLLVSSYYFYMAWKPGYALLLMTSTVVDYFAGLAMERSETLGRRRMFLFVSLGVNLGLLFFFKYYNFFSDSLESLFGFLTGGVSFPDSPFLLPLGISFYTFQTLGYAIDVYRGRKEAERHFGIFALYVAFFPQLVAGPIERAGNLLPQFRKNVTFDYERVVDGLQLMLWGMVKKVVIADRLAILVDQVYGSPESYNGFAFTIATVFFAFQIYCDFSGYSDIAIGAARIMGFRLMENFRRPYYAQSIADFWRRWHISLSTWFRDYVYISLGGNRVSIRRWYVNLVIVFLVSGLWHGANWTFMVWGGLHAFYMVASRVLAPFRERAVRVSGLDPGSKLLVAWRVAFTFGLVCFSWIFFRAEDMSDALYIVTHVFTGWGVLFDFGELTSALFSLGLTRWDFGVAVVSILVLEIGHMLQSRGSVREQFSRLPIGVRWSLYSAAMWAIVLLGMFGHKEFIYFTF